MFAVGSSRSNASEAEPHGIPTGAACADGASGAVTFANGSWAVDLKTRPAPTTPSTIVISSQGSKGPPVTLSNVLFGDVWGCHGQSNNIA